MAKGIKTREGGRRTEASFNSMIMSALRSRSMFWKCKADALLHAECGMIHNPITDRDNKAVECAVCGKRMPKAIKKGTKPPYAVDHIKPVIPTTGFDSWDGVVNRLYCEIDNWQVLCKECHSVKTKKENETRKMNKRKKEQGNNEELF